MWHRTKSQNNPLFTLKLHHAMLDSFCPLSTLCKPAPTDVPAFTICYHFIRSTSDIQLDIQKASYFLRSTLVDQPYAKEVYFCSYVTKSNQACTKYSPKPSHMYMISAGPKKYFLHHVNTTHPLTIKDYKLQKEQN